MALPCTGEVHDAGCEGPTLGYELGQLVGPTGAWLGRAGTDFHVHDAGLAAAVAAFLSYERPRRVLDMGCGLGDYVRALRGRGLHCDGFDGYADTASLTEGLCYTADFANPALPDEISAVGYDWCLCLEVFEHVPMHLEEQLVKCILAGTGCGLIISVATPGQGGLGHVNERPHEYIIELLEARGLVLDMITSLKLRRYCQRWWFQVNTLVFRRAAAFHKGHSANNGSQMHCGMCGAIGCKFRCAMCQKVWYCSVQCQCKAWTGHKPNCLRCCITHARSSNEVAPDKVTSPASMPPNDPSRERATLACTGGFDAVVSLGPNCLAAYRIAKAGLKRRSFPFDIVMSGADGWPAHEKACWLSPVGLRFVVECLHRSPPFHNYVASMQPLPHIRAVGNCGFANPDSGCIPSVHCHDDPRIPEVSETYARRAMRFCRLLASNYRTLFMYTLRLRDLYDADHISNVATGLAQEVVRLRQLFVRNWPELQYLLLIVVVGQLKSGVSVFAEAAIQQVLRQIANEQGNAVAIETIEDAPTGLDPKDGFWGDDNAWEDMFARYRVEPRDFSEPEFAQVAKRGPPKRKHTSSQASKFERFVDSLKEVCPS